MEQGQLLKLMERLSPPTGRVSMVLDTDTYNEVDDQFALSYALLSPDRIDVEAVYAAPFHNDRSTGPDDGMEKSYDEIVRLLALLGRNTEGFAFRGSRTYLPEDGRPVISPAAEDLVRRAMSRAPGDELYVVAIGAITNVASALIMEPAIAERITIVWLGGNPLYWPSAQEFNLMQDVRAARVVLDSGAPVVLVPCMGVSSHLTASAYEMRACLGGKNPLCDALAELFCAYSDDHFGWAKELWDVAAIAYLINPEWAPSTVEHSPLLSDDMRWSRDASRHPVRVINFLYRTPIFRDMYAKLAAARAE